MKFYFLHALKSNYELLQNVLQIVISDKKKPEHTSLSLFKLKESQKYQYGAAWGDINGKLAL